MGSKNTKSDKGKTNLITRYVQNTFTEQYVYTSPPPTFCALCLKRISTTPRNDSDPFPYPEYVTKRINVDSTEVLLHLVDFLYLRFSDGRNHFLGRSRGIFIVYDVTNRDSLQYLDSLMGRECDALIYLVANKVDNIENRVITTQEGIDLAANLESRYQVKIEYFETSAKENVNVDEMVTKMVKACLAAEMARRAEEETNGST